VDRVDRGMKMKFILEGKQIRVQLMKVMVGKGIFLLMTRVDLESEGGELVGRVMTLELE
jgi:hypothetical protein